MRTIYFIQETVKDKDGQYIPCIAVEGETGYHLTDWKWGSNKTVAQSIADDKNAIMGTDVKEAMIIQLSTMR